MSDFSKIAFDPGAIEARRRRTRSAPTRAPITTDGSEQWAIDCQTAIDGNSWVAGFTRQLEVTVANLADTDSLSMKQVGEMSLAHRMLRTMQRDYQKAVKILEGGTI